MSPKRLQFVQLFLEAALPLIGIIFWKWNFAFILFYYLFDWLANTFLTALKIRKCYTFKDNNNGNYKWLVRFLLSLALIAPAILFSLMLLNQVYPSFDLGESFHKFFFYEDMGIAQGYVLIPLIAVNAWTQYKMQFLLPQRFKTTSELKLVNGYLLQNSVILGGILFCFILCKLLAIHELFYSLFLIVGCLIFRYFQRY